MNNNEQSKDNTWTVYILQCNDNSLYTGITNHLQQRIEKHNAGKGAKYTRSRLPAVLVYQETVEDKSEALKREHQIKQLSRAEKLLLSKNQNSLEETSN